MTYSKLLIFTTFIGFATYANAMPDARQTQLLASNCLQCHAVEHTGAPQIGRAEDWASVIAQGEEATLKNVVEGIRGMPPLGYCSACSEQDLRVLLRFVSGMPTAANTDMEQQ